MNKIYLVGSILFLSACVDNIDRFENGYPLLKGMKVNQVVRELGTPDEEHTIMGKKVYEWNNTSYGMKFTPVTQNITSTSYGYNSSITTFGTATSHISQDTEYHCKLKIVADKNNRIIESSYKGAPGGCAKYGPGIERLTLPQTPTVKK